MASFKPSRIFRGISNKNLKSIFDHFQIEVPYVNWEAEKTDVKRLVEFWKDLRLDPKDASNRVGGLFRLFQEIHEVADAKVKATRVIREQIEWDGNRIKLPENFDTWTAYEQVAYIYVNHNAIWKPLVNKMQVDDIQNREKWREYGNLPMKEIDFDGVKECVESSICDFFRSMKNCRVCRVEQYAFTNDVQSFFATLDDEPTYIETKNEMDGDFEFQRIVMPFRVTFAYNYKEGEFSLYVENLSGKEKDQLANHILSALLVLPGEYIRIGKDRFDLSRFNDFDCNLPICAGISAARVRAIMLEPFDSPNEKLFFEDKTGSVYNCVRKHFSIEQNDKYFAKRVTISVDISNPALDFRTLTFELSEKTCTLKSMSEDRRVFGEKLLKFWELKK